MVDDDERPRGQVRRLPIRSRIPHELRGLRARQYHEAKSVLTRRRKVERPQQQFNELVNYQRTQLRRVDLYDILQDLAD
jgi:hypothetical protein